MSGKRQLAPRREDAQRGAMRLLFCGLYEHGLGEIELTRDALHVRGLEALSVEDNSERIAGKASGSEDVEGRVVAAHETILSNLAQHRHERPYKKQGGPE